MPASVREDRRQQRKLQRQVAEQAAARGARVRRFGFIGLGLAVIAIVAVMAVISRAGTAQQQQASAAEVTGPGTRFDDPITASGGFYQHIPSTQPLTIVHYPPTFGDHYDTPRPPGVYDNPVPEGYFVHDLEHGAIVVLFRCPTGCPDTVNQLKGLMNSLPKERFGQVKVVASPNDRIDHPVALLAWDWEQDLDAFDADAVRTFYRAHVDHGPEQAQI